MSARELLRAAASSLENFSVVRGYPVAQQAAALRALADRLDREIESAAKRERDSQLGGDERIETIAFACRNALARLDADLAPPAAPPPDESLCIPHGRPDCDDCFNAGAPRNPVKPCETCGGKTWINEYCKDDWSATHSVPCPSCTPGAKP